MSGFRFRDARFFAVTRRKRAVHTACIVAILFGLALLPTRAFLEPGLFGAKPLKQMVARGRSAGRQIA